MVDHDERGRQYGQPPPFGQRNTRRSFLGQLGKAGGAALMYESMQALGLFRSISEARADDGLGEPVAGGKTSEVLVLGGGIAGLTAAYELLLRGYKVTLLEARKRPGGRNWTARWGTSETELGGVSETCRFARGQYMNCGPARLPQGHITIDYCRKFGVDLQVFTNQNADGYYFNENTATTSYGPLASTKIRHRTAKADYYGYVSELLAKVVDQGALDAELTADDQERLLQFLRSFGSLTSANEYEGGSRRGYSVVPGAGNVEGTPLGPVPSVSDVLASRVGLSFSFEFGWDQAMLMFQPVGGMDHIAYAFEREVRKLGAKIIYGAEVTEIHNTASGVTVGVSLDGRVDWAFKAPHVICCIPPQVLLQVANNFSPAVLDALAEPIPQDVGKVGLQYKRRFWEEDERIMGGITNSNLNTGTIWYPSYGYLGEKGTVVGSYNFGANAAYYAGLSYADRIKEAIKQGSKIHGAAYRDEFETGWTVAWRKTRYTEGGWVDWESRDAGYQTLLAPEGNVYFAGDHLSYEIAWQAGAIYSARAAVKKLIEKVNTTALVETVRDWELV